MTVTSAARKCGVAPSQLFGWRKLVLKACQEIVSARDQSFAHGELRELKCRVKELEWLLGKATVEKKF
jgi:transposase